MSRPGKQDNSSDPSLRDAKPKGKMIARRSMVGDDK